MKISKDKSDFLDQAIEQWEDEGVIDESIAKQLRQTYEAKTFDWRRLAQYAFWIAITCAFFGLAALFVDEKTLELLRKLYDTPDVIICGVSAAVAIWLYIFSFKRKTHKPKETFSNEALTFGAVLLTANAIAYLGKLLGGDSAHFSLVILLSVVVYAALAWIFKSKLIWVFMLITLGTWYAAETNYLAKGSYLFVGMNFPLRFVLLGVFVTAMAFWFRRLNSMKPFVTLTYIGGLFYLFFSLWMLSIFGNYGSIDQWYDVRQISLFYWAFLSASACGLAIFLGLKYQDNIAREFGIVFLLLNLYTRYFEYFWDNLHKALFFLILAISFWLIGRKAEKIWNMQVFEKS